MRKTSLSRKHAYALIRHNKKERTPGSLLLVLIEIGLNPLRVMRFCQRKHQKNPRFLRVERV